MPRPIRSIIEEQEVISCPSETTVSEAALLMKRHEIGALMVVDDGKLVGVFTERDALFRERVLPFLEQRVLRAFSRFEKVREIRRGEFLGADLEHEFSGGLCVF